MKQLITYFTIAYVISWVIWLPLYGSAFGLTSFSTLPYHHGIGAFGPLIAAFATTWLFNKKDGVKKLIESCIQVRPLIYLATALLAPFLLAILAIVINYFVNKSPINFVELITCKEFPEFNIVIFFIYNLIFFGFGEEVGWRGFALPRLQERFNALTSSIILAVFWAIWHWPLFFYRPGYTSMDFVAILGWFFSLLTGSVLLTWLFNSSRASIFICAIFHSTIDIAFTADFADKNVMNYLGFLVTVWGILTIIIFKPKNLALKEI
jgi:membrane protease YdiL (CAAX protease family)